MSTTRAKQQTNKKTEATATASSRPAETELDLFQAFAPAVAPQPAPEAVPQTAAEPAPEPELEVAVEPEPPELLADVVPDATRVEPVIDAVPDVDALPQGVTIAESEQEIRKCFAVMSQLRPHLVEADFVEQVRRQQSQGYHLAFLEREGVVRAVAGYRYLENLAWGRFCYVDDLVTDATGRSQGLGRELFDWLVVSASEAGCEQFHLDSGVQRFDAHRFYLTRRMAITSHHFAMPLC